MDNIRKTYLPAALLIVVFLIYRSSLVNDIVNIDDPTYTAHEELILQITKNNIIKFFTIPVQGNYHPLTMASHAAIYHFLGPSPFWHHLTSMLLHGANAILVYFLFCALLPVRGIAFLTALLFAVHPLQVESVVWASQLKTLLYAFFFLLALLFYMRHLSSKKKFFLICSVTAFILSCLSKPMAVSLPLVLILIHHFRGIRFTRDIFTKIIPFFMISAICAFAAFISQKTSLFIWSGIQKGNLHYLFLYPVKSLVHYIDKLFFPIDLSITYTMGPDYFPWFFIKDAVILAAFISIIVCARNHKPVVFGGLFFVLTILPVLKIVPFGMYSVAQDRYVYISFLGLFFMMAYAGERLWRAFKTKIPFGSAAGILIAGTFLLMLANTAYQRTRVWSDSITLYLDTLVKHPDANNILGPLADAYMDQGRYGDALYYFERAWDQKALRPKLWGNLAFCYITARKYDKAEMVYKRLIEKEPRRVAPRLDLAELYKMADEPEKAKKMLLSALEISRKDNRADLEDKVLRRLGEL